jgi:putative chitinase
MTTEELKKIAPYASDESVKTYTSLLNKWMPYYSINTRLRQAAFLAQVIHETGSFRYMEEIATGSEYDTGKMAVRLGNTPERDGDGERYKGKGGLQITGKDNYEAVSKGLGVDFVSHPEKLKEPNYAIQSACWWWWANGLNHLADKGDLKPVTKKVNGGYNGYLDRVMYYKRALKTLK